MILRRLEMSRYSQVLPLWKDETVLVMCAGPSLTLDRVETVRKAHAAGRVKCIGVNDAYLYAPWLDVLYAADAKWHRWHTQGIAKPELALTAEHVASRWSRFIGQKCSIEWSGNDVPDNVHLVRNRDGDVHGLGLSTDPRNIATGRNGGAQAVNLAFLSGTKRILLLGIDGGPDKQGKTHAHGGHPTPTNPDVWKFVQQSFSAMETLLTERGVTVLNCSPESRIGFPKMEIGEALELECA